MSTEQPAGSAATATGAQGPSVGDYIRLSRREVLAGTATGLLAATPLPPPTGGARQAFEAAVRQVMPDDQPTRVLFSGGRDSSAVLAVATAVARRDGLPDPVPVTEYHPELPETDESSWQELVVEHLALREWDRVEVRGQTELLDDVATRGLERRGLVWPPALQAKAFGLARLTGCTILTGEGGDEVLGQRRMTVVRRGLEAVAKRDLASVREGLVALAPATARRRKMRERLVAQPVTPWLRDNVIRHNAEVLAQEYTTDPLPYGAAVWWLTRRRPPEVVQHNYSTLAAEFEATVAHPLLDHGFLAALARETGVRGYRSRTHAMHALFGDLLPTALVERRQKSSFNRAFMSEATHAFARDWDGAGVDPAEVDVEQLRAAWLSDHPPALSMTLLHHAWLASHGLPTTGADA